MTIDLAFGNLRERVREQREALAALCTTVNEDRPQRSDVAVASHLADAVLAARGALEEAGEALEQTCQDGDPAALACCHAAVLRYEDEFAREVLSVERIEHLCSVARERGREWAGWVGVVHMELEQCAEFARATDAALLECWREVGEGRRRVSLHNVSIGPARGLACELTERQID